MRLELEYTHSLYQLPPTYTTILYVGQTQTRVTSKSTHFGFVRILLPSGFYICFFFDQPVVRCVFYLHIWGSCLSAKQTLKLIVFYCVRGGDWCLWCGFFHRFLVFGSYDVAPRNPIKLGHFMWQPKIKFSVWMYFPWNHVNSRPFSRTAALVETTLKATRIWIP